MPVCRSEANQKWGGNMEHGRGDVNKKEGAPSSLPLPLNAVCVMSERMSRYHPCRASSIRPSIMHDVLRMAVLARGSLLL